ncbi:MAG TPA: hypothetical protein P5543_10515, partial [Planctomycetota bacterium]|nr:hypothetical protein [Planctomycetota bacterium]
PLFLDDLKDEFRNIKKQTILHEKKQALLDLQTKIASLTFLDPACGSGNFLTQTYISLRKLENLILESIHCIDKETNQQTPDLKIKVEIENFYGIEINDFAVTVAKTALWIAELQMMQKTESIMERKITFFPLKTNAYIHEENALQMDWQDIIPKDKLHYIIGNPPFLGSKYMTKQQRKDQSRLTTNKRLDYVACWYYKAAEYIQNTDVRVAFVSTSSIVQGEQLSPLWTDMIEKYGLHIDFCHRTFIWDQESDETILYRERQLELATTRKQGAQKQGKKQKQERIKKAQVHCVIIGFSQTKNNKEKIIFTYTKKLIKDNLENKKTQKKYETIVTKQIANNINPYLVDAPNIIVKNRLTPLCDIPKMIMGNSPIDGGNLIIKENEIEEFIKKEPKTKKFIKKFMSAEELIYNKDRYVLWLVDATPQEIKSMPLVQERIEKVRDFRLKSPTKSTRKKAMIPYLFSVICQPTTSYLAIPIVSSERRNYIPMNYLPHTTICNNKLQCIPDCPLYIFAILNSQAHNAWMRVVAGRLKSDYQYASSVVYNNFPFPELTETQKQKLNELGQNILDVRAKYPDSNLAALYDPLTMPSALLKAHQKLDKEVAKIYNKNWNLDNEAEIVSDLMQMYQQLLTTETTNNKNIETTDTIDDETTENTEDDDIETTDTEDDETTEHTEYTELEYTDNTETTDNKNIETTEHTEHTELEYTDNTENINKKQSTKTKTRKIKKTDNNETEDKENKQTKVKTRKTKKTDNNETETEIYASIPIISKRTIKKVTKPKVAIKKATTSKATKIATKPKSATKATNKKATISKAIKKETKTMKETKITNKKVNIKSNITKK